jgi:vitamin B12 transporter
MNRISASILASFLLPASSFLLAQDTARVAPVVVTATRAPVALSSLPVSVVVLKGEDLKLRGITSVADALNDVSSAYVAQSGSQGGQTSIFLRGGESKYVKVLIDGVPANDPGGVYDFASLTTDNIDRIEIVRGPVSVVHGADAVTGVVQIITKRGDGAMRVEAVSGMSTSSRRSIPGQAAGKSSARDFQAGVSGAITGGSFSVSLSRHAFDGLYALNNSYYNNVLSGRVLLTPAAGTEVRIALRYNDYRFNYPTNGAGDVVDTNAYRAEDRTVFGVEVERTISSSLKTSIAINSSLNDGGTDDGADAAGNYSISQDKVRRRSAEWRLQWVGARATATTGAVLEQQDQRSQLQSNSTFGPYNSLFRAARRNSGAYVEVVATPIASVTATVGARYDDNEQFGSFRTGRAGLSWRPLSDTRLRATVGTAFREPSFFENFGAFGQGNPGLVPEQTRSLDFGVDQTLFGRIDLSASVFLQHFRNIIDYDPSSSCGFNYCNVAAADANGLDIDARARIIGGWSAAVSGTFLATEVTTPGYDVSTGGSYRQGEALIRRPATKWSGDLTYQGGGKFSGVVRVMSVGARGDRDFHTFPSTPVTLTAYQRVDLGGEYRVGRVGAALTSLTARVENLLDASYENVFNFLAPRRTIGLGVKAAF